MIQKSQLSLKNSVLLQVPRNERHMGKHQSQSGGRSKRDRKAWPRVLIMFSMEKAKQGRESSLKLASLNNIGSLYRGGL